MNELLEMSTTARSAGAQSDGSEVSDNYNLMEDEEFAKMMGMTAEDLGALAGAGAAAGDAPSGGSTPSPDPQELGFALPGMGNRAGDDTSESQRRRKRSSNVDLLEGFNFDDMDDI